MIAGSILAFTPAVCSIAALTLALRRQEYAGFLFVALFCSIVAGITAAHTPY